MADSCHRRISGATRQAIESLAESVLDWLETRCMADRNYAFGNTLETTWSEETCAFLIAQGKTASHQHRYPGPRKSCDIVTLLPEQQELWIE
jgi:hypothetical protein